MMPECSMKTATKRRRLEPQAIGSGGRASGRSHSQALQLGALNGHLGYFVRRLQVAIFKGFIRSLAPMKVRPAQFSVLVLISENPGHSQAAIGEALNIERARLARLLHELERRKWVQRRTPAGDGRRYSLFLTDEGEKAIARIQELASGHEAELAQRIGHKRRIMLMDLLRDFG
jgi:DNA-binding MarR family transcriptional regulator